MKNNFNVISPESAEKCNVFEKIGKEWMLITAESGGVANTMTASWGTLGVLWGKPVAICYIRPQRFTYPIVDNASRLSLCFLTEEHREAMRICGTLSGRDVNKFEAASLELSHFGDVPYVAESETVLICKKLYADMIKEEAFCSAEPLVHYPTKDFHKFFVCEIEKVLVAKK